MAGQDPAPGPLVSLFERLPVSSAITPGIIDEASGITDSRANPGFLWVQQDSGNPPELFLVSYDGSHLKKIYIKGIQNRDWEDLALGKGPRPDLNYIYLADIGDNNLQYGNYAIYRFEEPSAITDTVFVWEKISFEYPDRPHDAEALIVDPETKDIYIITKRDAKSRIFKLPYPHQTPANNIITALLVAELPFNGVLSAALSGDAKEIILKTDTSLNYWSRQPGESIEAALKKPASILPYQQEPQGEAVCFKIDNSGIFTLSERPAGVPFVTINFYKRK